MAVLVTGAAGFIGAATSRALLERGDEVFGIDNLNSYYDPALKQARLDKLSDKFGERFRFKRVDFADANELRRALEEGVWPDEEPPPKALLQDGGIPQPERVRLRAWAEVVDHVTINDRRTLDSLSPYYIWTPDYAEKRLSWKRRHPLHVLLLRVHRIPRPVTVRVRDEYHGCRSWVEIDRELPFEGTPVMAEEEFDRARQEIMDRCGAAEPVLA